MTYESYIFQKHMNMCDTHVRTHARAHIYMTTIFINLHPSALIHMEIYTYIYYLHIFIIYASQKCNKYSKAIHEKRNDINALS